MTKNLKAKILQQFKAGASIAECATWYNQQAIRVEHVIREAMIEADQQERPLTAAELVAKSDDDLKSVAM